MTTINQPVLAPFGASTYNDPDATRLNMELDLSGAQALELAKLDDWLREAGKKLGIRGEMTETCHRDKHGNERVRLKVSCGGAHGGTPTAAAIIVQCAASWCSRPARFRAARAPAVHRVHLSRGIAAHPASRP